jgi:hypothetical protein
MTIFHHLLEYLIIFWQISAYLKTTAHFACEQGIPETVNILISQGAQINCNYCFQHL